ncbi:hypothetical protein AAFF_G00339680 [Aldrovandia affinis]|uniref:Uncharacterized protein n=1 Tax=Aldrovandia affinis TaxID=143900 RepID=A0AAD7SK95_9TELE|nr:hypothetical protein AAFF_G00339680 [Aldrovandia affinis]
MGELHKEWEAELGGGAEGCWVGARGRENRMGGGRARARPLVKLSPPPLFRGIGMTGASASLPPHRRLRSVFHRSRAVLPSDARVGGDAPSQACSLAVAPASTWNHPGGLSRTRSFAGVHSPTGSRAKTVSPTDTPADGHLATPAFLNRQIGGQPCYQPLLSSRTHCEGKGRWVGGGGGGTLSLVRQGNDPPKSGGVRAEERMRRARRLSTEGRREPCPVNKRWGLSAQDPERAEDRDLCTWLESLGLTDSEKDTSSTAATDRQCRTLRGTRPVTMGAWPVEGKTGPCRKDRRPHFLPPISQSVSLLDVPLLLPKNSPPPSPCSLSDAFVFPLPVPRLHSLPPKRK